MFSLDRGQQQRLGTTVLEERHAGELQIFISLLCTMLTEEPRSSCRNRRVTVNSSTWVTRTRARSFSIFQMRFPRRTFLLSNARMPRKSSKQKGKKEQSPQEAETTHALDELGRGHLKGSQEVKQTRSAPATAFGQCHHTERGNRFLKGILHASPFN